ncbi:chemotaxis-specific protein-glutamate methyltransferase CheB [bacterium]|nr:chemotaxis-specific protein-glutamate methyltransferase CheB [bacterium]
MSEHTDKQETELEAGPIKILIVDDSPISRDILEAIIKSDSGLTIVGFAENGRESIGAVERLKPDIVTMDLNMPIMNGFEAIENIMAFTPTPILVVTTLEINQDPRLAFDALAVGALDIINRPSLPETGDVLEDDICREFINKLKLLAHVKVITHIKGKRFQRRTPDIASSKEVSQKIVVIASSTGGPKALKVIISSLPSDFSAAVVVVQHMSDGFIPGLVQWLKSSALVDVKQAEEGDRLQAGRVYVAPTGYHLKIDKLGRLLMVDLPPVAGLKPCADILFESAARLYGPRTLGVILTGMGQDGTKGCAFIKEFGGRVIAQDTETSVIASMPHSAFLAGHVDCVKPLGAVADEIQHQLLTMK